MQKLLLIREGTADAGKLFCFTALASRIPKRRKMRRQLKKSSVQMYSRREDSHRKEIGKKGIPVTYIVTRTVWSPA